MHTQSPDSDPSNSSDASFPRWRKTPDVSDSPSSTNRHSSRSTPPGEPKPNLVSPLQELTSEGQFISVMGHELGHVERQHSMLNESRARVTGVFMLWIVGLTNAFNLVDGMDGLAAGLALIAAVGFGIIAALEGSALVVAISLTALAKGLS